VRAAAIGVISADPLDEFVAVEFRHHQIEEDQVDFAVSLQFFESDRAILGQVDIELHALEDGLKKNADRQIVVDDEDSAAGSVDLTDHGCQPHWLSQNAYRAEAYLFCSCCNTVCHG
jgi:hypothetical protein